MRCSFKMQIVPIIWLHDYKYHRNDELPRKNEVEKEIEGLTELDPFANVLCDSIINDNVE